MLKNLVYLGTFTLIIIFSWVAFGIYNSVITSTITPDAQILISPIPASFDLDVIKNITDREVILADLSSNKVVSSQSAKPTPQIVRPTTQPVVIPTPISSPIITTNPLPGLINPASPDRKSVV